MNIWHTKLIVFYSLGGNILYKPVDSKASFPALEEEVLKFWEDNDVFKKSIEQRKDSSEYVFYDGPPFATGLPHFGHFIPSTIKDIIPRYQTMKGKKVERRFGWDCHGLPVENLIEKELGLNSKTEIEDYYEEDVLDAFHECIDVVAECEHYHQDEECHRKILHRLLQFLCHLRKIL